MFKLISSIIKFIIFIFVVFLVTPLNVVYDFIGREKK